MKNLYTVSFIALASLTSISALAQNSLVLPTLEFQSQSGILQSWMNPEVGGAWSKGYKGSGVTITTIDDFRSSNRLSGNFGTGMQSLRHGEWTSTEAKMIAPEATMKFQDFSQNAAVGLSTGLNVLNLSYGMLARAGYNSNNIGWSSRENSIISYAKNGLAVVSKAAGNDSVAIGAANSAGNVDYLNLALKGAKSAIFVGALSSNGTTASKASLASYSNKAGADVTVQRQFLVVGVEGSKTGLYGTSFAAPIISGYSAILGSKFTSASPTQIANQLLNTARSDTISNYSAAVHGRGEASIARALAPTIIR